MEAERGRILNEMNRDNINPTIRGHQPVIPPATIKKPTNKSPTMTITASTVDGQQLKPTTSGGGDGKGKGKSKSPGANMGISTNNKKVVGRPITAAGQPVGLMKKARVRFDDYLDLNEENMRRSCKRLMNHLYSEPNSSPSSSSAAAGGANANASVVENSCGATAALATIRKSPADEASKKPAATGAVPIKPSIADSSSFSKSKSDSTDISINCKTAAAGQQHQQQKHHKQNSTIATSLPTNGKSYLRSQYERRQQRQLELMSKMQLDPGKQQPGNNNNNNNNANGANECRRQQQQQEKQLEHQKQQRQQQDLVAKSHELSKRRFFEKLERRESIRNLNLSTPPPPPPPLPGASRQKVAAPDATENCPLAKISPKTMGQAAYNEAEQDQQQQPSAESRQNGLGDDELMLKVYQSIVLKGTDLNTTTETTSSNCDIFRNDTLGRLDGTQAAETTSIVGNTKELANEPIGFYTQSPQSQPNGDGQRQQLLIEFSIGEQQQRQENHQLIQLDENPEMSNSTNSCCFDMVAQPMTTELANHSAFEIKVPETLNSSQNPLDGFISSSLLIVKQVEVATEDSRLLPAHRGQQQQQQQLSASSARTKLVGGPPTLSGRHHKEGDASVRLVANKTKMPPNDDELAGSKIEQIDDHSTDKAMIINRSIIVGGATSLGSSSNSLATMAAFCAGDQYQEQALASITISSENTNNNRNSNSNTDELMNKAIRPIEEFKTTTTSNGVEHGGESEREEFEALLSEHSNQWKASGVEVEVSGAGVGKSNCVKDYEAPEMRMLIGQPGGATEVSANGDLVAEPDDVKENSVYLPQTHGAAQAQQAASLQTTITTEQPEIRDVLPIANEINRIEAIVSGGGCSRPGPEALVSNIEKITVVNAVKQVNEVYGSMVQQERSDQRPDGYANSVPDEVDMRENNVNHDVCSEAKLNAALSNDGNGTDTMGEHNHHLIESFTETKHHSSLTQKHSNSLSVEEDGGSSCSSSGFGASVSVTSSSESSNSFADTLLVVAGPNKRESGAIRRPNSLAVQVPSRNSDSIYDSVRPRAWAGRYQQQQQQQPNIVPGSESTSITTNEFADYKQRVGPDQAYPLGSGRSLLVENLNYASILSRRDVRDGTVLGQDDLVEGYANLPMARNNINHANKTPPNVEYATVRPPTISNNSNGYRNSNSSNNLVSNQGKTKRLNDSVSAVNLSGHSYSTTSENSGGFSALPPARLECPSSNNSKLSADLNTDISAGSSPKKSSILKRFGSLVSKAFTSQQTNVQSQLLTQTTSTSTSKINELSSNHLAAEDLQVSGSFKSNGIEKKSALVIERNCQLEHKQLAAHKEQKIGEADLVILPPKHVNQRKQQPNGQQQHQNLDNARPHDDRLSRGNRHSRKLKKMNSTSVASLSTPASSSGSASLSSLSASSTNVRIQSNEQHPKRSESLFEDLESLVSNSEQSNLYGRIGSLRRSRRRATSSSQHKQPTANMKRLIEIDCISPDRLKGERKSVAVTSATSTKVVGGAGGPRSLLRIFNTISSQKSSESTPNLVAPMQSSCSDYTSNFDPLLGEQEAADQSSLQPISGFWGFSSLMMSSSHARADITTTGELSTKASRDKAQTKTSAELCKGKRQNAPEANSSMVYSNLQPADSYSLHLPSRQEHHSLDKYQSLNLYQNLLRNYAKRRNRNRHGHHHHSHNHHGSHHHQHSHNHHRSTRHSYRSTRCSAQNCQLSSSSSEISGANQGRAVVWGQLIKINKTDGSQVVELQRLPGKSWGFFVARGAINDIKGIFISRMHDSVTSNSLAGLLSIGDRILAIDEYPIEPDYDILRVNHMMSKKSKILLKVKPFKG